MNNAIFLRFPCFDDVFFYNATFDMHDQKFFALTD